MNTLSTNRLKALAAYRQQKACEADGLFVVECIKMAEEALRSGWKIRVLCATPEAWRAISDRHDATFVSVELYEAKPEQIERLSSLRTPQGIWLLVERPQAVEVSRNEDFVLALDGIQDPGNMGLVRCATCAVQPRDGVVLQSQGGTSHDGCHFPHKG